MARPWHHADPGLFETLVKAVRAHYPDLTVCVEQDRVRVRGPFALMDSLFQVDSYEIDIELPTDFPEGVPLLKEVAGRIPRDADHHVNPDGSACLFVSGERWRYWPRGSSFIDFLNGPVISFLVGQALVERGEPWPFGERSHGGNGVLEAYSEMLGISDPGVVTDYLRVLARAKLRRHRGCPCGSGRPIRDCHIEQIVSLRGNITQREADIALKQIDTNPAHLQRNATMRGERGRHRRNFHSKRPPWHS